MEGSSSLYASPPALKIPLDQPEILPHFKKLPSNIALKILLYSRQWSSFTLNKALSFREVARILASSKEKSITEHLAFCVNKFICRKIPLNKVMDTDLLGFIKFEDPSSTFKNGYCYGHLDVVKLLLNDPSVKPADEGNLKDPEVNTAIYLASENGHSEVVKLLLNDKRFNPGTAIDVASENGHLEIVKLLLNDPRVNPADSGVYLAIWLASRSGHSEVVKLLLNDKRFSPDGAIDVASENGHLEVVKALLADPRVSLVAAIERASENGHLEVVRALLADARNNPANNNFAIRMAIENGHIEVAQALCLNMGIIN